MLTSDVKKKLYDLTTEDIVSLVRQVATDRRLTGSDFKDLKPGPRHLPGRKEENIQALSGWYNTHQVDTHSKDHDVKLRQARSRMVVQVFEEKLTEISKQRDKVIFERAKGRTQSSKSSHYYKPTRDDVEVSVWQERDRLHIGVDYKHGKMPASPLVKRDIADWWDDDASQMFEDGFFKRMGPMGEKDPKFVNSVIEYCEQMGILRK